MENNPRNWQSVSWQKDGMLTILKEAWYSNGIQAFVENVSTEGLSAEVRCDLWSGNSCNNQPALHEAQRHLLAYRHQVYVHPCLPIEGSHYCPLTLARNAAEMIHRHTRRHDQLNRCWVDRWTWLLRCNDVGKYGAVAIDLIDQCLAPLLELSMYVLRSLILSHLDRSYGKKLR